MLSCWPQTHREKLILFLSSFCYFSSHLSLPFLANCWDKPIHAWLVLSLSGSVLNKTCAPHTCKSQAPCLLRASRIPRFPPSLHSPPLYLSRCISVHFLSPLCSRAPPPFSVFPPPFLSLLFPLLPPSLLHLIVLILPGDRLWTERFPLSYKSCEWLTALSALPKLSRQHPPLPYSLKSRGRRRRKRRKRRRRRRRRRSVQDHTIVFAATRYTGT